MSARLALVVILAVVPSLAHAGAGDDLLTQAQAAADELDFTAARTFVDRAIETGELDPEGLARAYRMAGELAAAADDPEAAQAHFVRWLLLDHDAALADGESPKITAPFASARVEAGNAGELTVEITAERKPGKIFLHAEANDPLQLIAGLRVRLPSGTLIEHRGLDVELPMDDQTPFESDAIVFDEHGNALAIRPILSPPLGADVAETTTTARGHRVPAPLRWPTWAVLTVLTGGAGTYFGFQVDSDRGDLANINGNASLFTYDDYLDAVDRGERHALYTNVAFGAAAVSAIVTLVTYLLD